MEIAAALLAVSGAAGAARADNIVLKNGQRLNVTGYQLIGDKYRLQMNGGFVEVAFEDVAAIEPEDVFAVPLAPAPAIGKSHYRDLVETSASRWNVDADLISSVIATESNFNARAVSRKNARGLMQLMPSTAARLGVHDIFDPQQNIDAGTQYLGNLLARYRNDLSLALAAYNAGPERVQQYGRVPPFAETVSYVRRVQKSYATAKAEPAKNKTAGGAGASAGAKNQDHISDAHTASNRTSTPASAPTVVDKP